MLNLELPYDPAILLLGINTSEKKIYPHKNLYTHAHCSIINNQNEKTTQNLWIDEGTNRIWYIYTTEALVDFNKEWGTLTRMKYWCATRWMHATNIISKRRQTQKVTYYVIPFMWNIQFRQINRQGGRHRSSRVGGKGSHCLSYRVSFLCQLKCSKIEWGDTCKILQLKPS